MLSGLYIAFFILAGLSMIGSVYVIYSIVQFGSQKSCFTFLLLSFHLSMFAQEIVTLPYVFSGNEGLCEAVQFFHFYFGLMNILIVTMLVEAHRSSIFTDYWQAGTRILKYGLPIMLCFPMMTILPFCTGSYHAEHNKWCTLPYDSSSVWAIAIYYSWIWLFLLVSFLLLVFSAIRIFKSDRKLARKFISTIGLYIIVAILSWIPRSMERLAHFQTSTIGDLSYFISYIPINISGILYTMIFIHEKESLKQYEEEVNEDQRFNFSWESNDFGGFSSQNTSKDNSIATITNPIATGGVTPFSTMKTVSTSELERPLVFSDDA